MNFAGHCQRHGKTDRMAAGSVELEMVLDLVGGPNLAESRNIAGNRVGWNSELSRYSTLRILHDETLCRHSLQQQSRTSQQSSRTTRWIEMMSCFFFCV